MIGKRSSKPYEPAMDNDGNWYPKGPGTGLSYYGGYLFPETRCANEAEAKKICKLMNTAFAEGIKKNQRELAALLGLC